MLSHFQYYFLLTYFFYDSDQDLRELIHRWQNLFLYTNWVHVLNWIRQAHNFWVCSSIHPFHYRSLDLFRRFLWLLKIKAVQFKDYSFLNIRYQWISWQDDNLGKDELLFYMLPLLILIHLMLQNYDQTQSSWLQNSYQDY